MHPCIHRTVVLLGFALATWTAGLARADDDAAAPSIDSISQHPGAGNNEPPRLTRTEFTTDASRSALGMNTLSTEVTYRWWHPVGDADISVGIGALSVGLVPVAGVGLVPAGTPTALGSASVLTIGMRYRASPGASFYADASGVRGMRLHDRAAVVGKLGVEFKAVQSRWNLAYGGLGLNLGGDTRMTLKLRKGGFGIAMRRSF